MSFDEARVDEILFVLTDPELNQSEFDAKWVQFVCEYLPTFTQEDLFELGSALEDYIGNSYVTNQHRGVLRKVIERCFPEIGVSSPALQPLKVGLALVETCSIYDPSDLDISVFENITNFEAAKELFAVMAIEGNRHLGIYINYLDKKGIINVHDWNTSRQWPTQSALPSGNEPNVPPVYRGKNPAYQISHAAQNRFPFLQDAIDDLSSDPAFPTIWPMVSKLASQIAREGQLTRHIALLGPPGVGKTESARILHQILKSMGAVGHKFEKFTPGEKTEQYVDKMALHMRQLLNTMKTSGGLILVDEAGKFYEGTRPNDPASFRKRTLDVVFEQAETLLNKGVVVVFAGYRDAFEKVLEQDEGWSRRVLLLDIDPPTAEQLANYVWANLAEQGIVVPPNFVSNVKWLFDEMIEDSSMNFGYWATANNFGNALLDSATGDFLTSGDDSFNEITPEDFIAAARDIGFKSSRIRELDFSSSISTDFGDHHDIDAELRTFLDPPGPPGHSQGPDLDL